MAKSEPLFLTDAEVASRVGLSANEWDAAAIVLQREGLPMPDPLFKNRRYWPAVRAFLDRRYNLLPQTEKAGSPVFDGAENWKHSRDRRR